jgi:S-methylmethionine-dependent homocysteine/selenocysteine methylase
MSRPLLPQLDGNLFLTDGGIETTLIFQHGFELPYFAAFDLLRRPAGRDALLRYFWQYAELARAHGAGLVLESPTWRASADWGAKLGYSERGLADANVAAIDLLREIRDEFAGRVPSIVLSGCVGPRGDGYVPEQRMTPGEAHEYHSAQIRTFSRTAANLVTAITMNYVEEAIGIARAAGDAGLPVAISFTVETDGHLPTGESLEEAIERVDAVTGGLPAYYMINCAHPVHFAGQLRPGAAWLDRIGGLRVNASARSHAELNESTTLDDGNPVELGRLHAPLLRTLKRATVVGGCCGTDHRHVDEIAKAALFVRRQSASSQPLSIF